MGATLTTPKGAIALRMALPEDAVALRELRLESLADHPQAFGSDYALAAAESAESWVTRITQFALENVGAIFVALADGQLVGMTGIVRGSRIKTRHNATIWGVYVKPEWRGRHVGEALIGECAAWAKAHALLMMKLAVITSNAPAIRCYARCGFTIYGIDPKVIYHDGIYYDELLMYKPV